MDYACRHSNVGRTELTWSQVCKDGQVDCATAYSMLRKGAKVLGKVSESHRRIVLENDVQCDLPVHMMRGLLSTMAKVNEELRKSAGQACNGQSLTNVSNLFKEVVTDNCFAPCVNETTTDFETQQLACGKKPDNTTALLMGVMMLPGCKGLPPTTIEEIAENLTKLTQVITSYMDMEGPQGQQDRSSEHCGHIQEAGIESDIGSRISKIHQSTVSLTY